MSVVTKRCRDCLYYSDNSRHHAHGWASCDYILLVGHSRGCPAGDECTRYTPMKNAEVTPEFISAMLRFYDQGLSDLEIGRAIGKGRFFVRYWRRKLGLISNRESEADCRED